jgi:hypothetical protein
LGVNAEMHKKQMPSRTIGNMHQKGLSNTRLNTHNNVINGNKKGSGKAEEEKVQGKKAEK